MLKSVNVHEMNNDLLQFREELQVALQNKNIISLSEVQRQCIPHACKGEDIFAQAPTGSGKTYAYLLPILERIEIQGKGKH
jgi:superfamily II DNA/RNA helicase